MSLVPLEGFLPKGVSVCLRRGSELLLVARECGQLVIQGQFARQGHGKSVAHEPTSRHSRGYDPEHDRSSKTRWAAGSAAVSQRGLRTPARMALTGGDLRYRSAH